MRYMIWYAKLPIAYHLIPPTPITNPHTHTTSTCGYSSLPAVARVRQWLRRVVNTKQRVDSLRTPIILLRNNWMHSSMWIKRFCWMPSEIKPAVSTLSYEFYIATHTCTVYSITNTYPKEFWQTVLFIALNYWGYADLYISTHVHEKTHLMQSRACPRTRSDDVATANNATHFY